MTDSQGRASAPTCSRCGEEAEFELIDHLNGVPLPYGEPYCAVCAAATGLEVPC